MILRGRTLVPGRAAGAVAAIAPLSFWGGFDAATGNIVDRSHASFGATLGGRILVMSAGRGSSSSSSVLAEAIRRGSGPAAILLAEPDPILAVGAMVAETLYGIACPVAVLASADHVLLAQAAFAGVEARADAALIVLKEGQ